jgi:hypothetical protein
VDTFVLAERELRATDRADGDGASRFAIDSKRFGKIVLILWSFDVENVTTAGIPFQVNEMKRSVSVYDGLRLEASVWGANHMDQVVLLCATQRGAQQESQRTCQETLRVK